MAINMIRKWKEDRENGKRCIGISEEDEVNLKYD